MNRNRCLIAAAVLLAWMTTGPGWGVQGTVTHTLKIIHRQNIVLNDSGVRTETHTLKKSMPFEISSNEEVRIIVQDPNPFLYTYTLDGIDHKDTQDFQNIQQLVSQLQQLQKVLGGGASTSSPTEIMTSGVDLGARELLTADTRMSKIEKAISGKGLKSLSADDLRYYIDQLKQNQDTSKKARIEEILQQHQIDQAFFQSLGDSVKDISDRLETIPGLIKRSAGSELAVQAVKDSVKAWNLPVVDSDLRSKLKTIDDAEFEILNVLGPVTAEYMSVVDSRLYALLITKDQAPKVLDSLNTAEDFSKKVELIDVPIEITKDPIPFSATQDTIVKVTIKSVDANATIANATNPKRFQDTIAMTFSPLGPVHYGFGGAMVYSFVRKSEFKAEMVNGALKISERKGAAYSGQNVAAVLTITPRAWDNPIFGAQFQLGFNPKKDELAFFLGMGIRVFTLARIGAGITYQEVPKLAAGLVPNQQINSASDLKLDTEFKTGGYIFISITTK